MKRSPMPKRKQPLRNGSTPLRRGALLRGAAISRAAAKPKPAKAHVWPPGMRDAVRALAGDCCDMCGFALPERWECHHRRLRSQGGRDEVVNALALHFKCHDFAHDNRTWAQVRGYIVHRPDNPATRPVLRHGRFWQLPTADGWVDVDPPTDITPTEERAA